MFKVMLDTKSYSIKPTSDELRNHINNRLIKNPIVVTSEQLAHELTSGKSFVPAFLGTLNSEGKIARQKECWTSQQIICLDFDNQIMVDNPDYPNRSDKKKIKQKKITLTWDQAKSEFKDKAIFMYKSFSCTNEWPKFRVVLAFNEVITERSLYLGNAEHFISKYPYVDQSSIEENRLFYGGTDLYVFDYMNRIKIDKSKLCNSRVFVTPNISNKHSNNWSDENPLIRNNVNINKTYKFDNIQLLKNKEKYFSKLTNQIFKPVCLSSRGEVYDYIKSYDMRIFLDLHDKSFYDLFHQESNKSASIFQSNKTGFWYYKCHSESYPFYGTLFDVVSRLTGYNNVKTFRYLCEIFNITIQKTEWQVEQEQMYRQNLDFIKQFLEDRDNFTETAYPYLSNLFRSPLYFQVVREMNEIGLDVLESLIKLENTESDNGVFFASISHIMKRIYGSSYENDKFKDSKKKSVITAIGVLLLLKMLIRHDINTLPETYTERSRELAKKSKYKNVVEFYSIPSYDANLMIEVEEIAKEFRRLGLTVKNFDRQMVLQSFGQEEADRCFPNRKNEKISELNVETCGNLEKILVKYIDEFGWVTEQRVLEDVELNLDVQSEMRKRNRKINNDDIITEDEMTKWLEQYKKSQYKKAIGGFIAKYNLIKQPLNKKLMNELNIPMHYNEKGNPSYPTIIYRS